MTQDRFKFRAWHPNDGMQYIEYFYWFEEQGINDLDDASSFSGQKFIFMQCTGLKDKNDEMIWEGDIVKHFTGHFGPGEPSVFDCSIYEVKFGLQEDGDDCFYGWPFRFFAGGEDEKEVFSKIEVIGNIYENPELLQK